MQQRTTIITLGVNNLIESEKFYSNILGWEKMESSSDGIIFYALNGFRLALYPLGELADDAKVKYSELDFRGFTLAYNTKSKDEVDMLFHELSDKGVEIVKQPEDVFWGGYSGYFADPDRNLWEVAYNPFMTLNKDGIEVFDSNVKINIAEITDLETILELQKEAYKQEAEIYNDYDIQPLKQSFASLKQEWQNGIILKAEKHEVIIGSVRAEMAGCTCKIGKLIVHPNFQNQGIGKMLMQQIEMAFDNCEVYELFTGNKSEKNLAIYHKSGYHNSKEEILNDNIKLIYLQKRNELQNAES